MLNAKLISHLEKYFRLSQKQFKDADYALAAFFAITTIEEAAKVLISNSTSRKWSFEEIHNHREKYLSALINLVTESPSYEKMTLDMKEEVDSWWDTKKMMKLRNDALYMSVDKGQQLKPPTNKIGAKKAALLVYIAGIALAELDEYIAGLPSRWKKSTLEVTEVFRQQYLKD